MLQLGLETQLTVCHFHSGKDLMQYPAFPTVHSTPGDVCLFWCFLEGAMSSYVLVGDC